MEKEKQMYYDWEYESDNKIEIEFGNIIEKETGIYEAGFTSMGFYGGCHSRDEEVAYLKAQIERLEQEKEEIILDKNMYYDLSNLLKAEIEIKELINE